MTDISWGLHFWLSLPVKLPAFFFGAIILHNYCWITLWSLYMLDFSLPVKLIFFSCLWVWDTLLILRWNVFSRGSFLDFILSMESIFRSEFKPLPCCESLASIRGLLFSFLSDLNASDWNLVEFNLEGWDLGVLMVLALSVYYPLRSEF